MNTQNFTENGNQKFPLTTEALDFIQEQIKLVYGLTNLAGQFIIISEPKSNTPGLIIVDGELLPLYGMKTTSSKIVVSQVDTSVELGNGSFNGILRSDRRASYSIATLPIVGGLVPRAASNGTEYALSKFTVLKNIETLMSELDEAKKHHVPKGSVIDWYGNPSCENIPYGFVPCGYFFGGHTDEELSAEMSRWMSLYGGNNISVGRVGNGGKLLSITKCLGMDIPQLHDRFIVAAGNSYSLGKIGGADTVTLTAAQSGLPDSVVTGISKSTGKAYSGTSASQHDCTTSVSATTKGYHNATASHENRPPYFALYKLIKVI